MKKPLSLMLCTLIVIASISITPLSHARILQPNDDNLGTDNLILKTCLKTPDPTHCVLYIKAHPKSATVKDVAGIGLIMVDVLEVKASIPHDAVFALLYGTHKPDQEAPLKKCWQFYGFDLINERGIATQAFTRHQPKLAEDAANSVMSEVSTCQKPFAGDSPITNENNVVHGVAILIAAIARQL